MPEDKTKTQIQCLICGQFFDTLAGHVKQKHDIDVIRYREEYGPVTPEEQKEAIKSVIPKPDAAEFYLNEVKEEDLVRALTKSTFKLFSKQAQARVMFRALQLLEHRVGAYYEASGFYKVIVDKLKKRAEDKDISIKDLINIGYLLQNDIGLTAKTVLGGLNAIVQDNKSVAGKAISDAPPAFSGEHDTVKVPENMTPFQREIARKFFESMMNPIEASGSLKINEDNTFSKQQIPALEISEEALQAVLKGKPKEEPKQSNAPADRKVD